MANVTSCPAPMKATSNGAFQNENPLDYALPLLIVQICLVVAFTRTLAFILRPLRQPRVIAEIIGGILLGPSAVGRSQKFLHTIFPARSMTVLDTVANIGLLYFLFLVGLELDLRAIRRTGKKSLGIAMAGIGVPFVLGIGTSVVLRSTISKGVHAGPFLVFMGVSLSITAFPVLARILAELKLLTTDVGRMAMSAAAVNDVVAWVLLALAIALSGTNTSPLITLWVLLCGIGFIVFCFFALRPLLVIMARKSPDGEPVKETYICIILTLVLAASFVTDTIGIHALFGAFVVGILVPKDGPLAGILIEKIEDLVSGLFLPLYFASSGLKTNVATISGALSWGLLVLVILTACFGKIVGTVVVSSIFKVKFREALALGFLMNTKGLVELIVLNIGKDRKVLNDETFAVLVLMALFTTFITTPVVMMVYKPARQGTPYKHRTVQRKDPDTEFRLLTCFHSSHHIPTMINFIECSRGTRPRGKLVVYAMHLMELSERSSAISMVHKARNNGLPFWNKKKHDGDQMIIAFEAYKQLSRVTIRPMTAISSFHTIHEDICTSAHQKHAAMILLPFHKQQRVDGSFESMGHSLHQINIKVLAHAPCSVAILVDRALGGTTQVSSSDVSYRIVVPFFGGRDDNEALSSAIRMAEHPGISLKVIKFVGSIIKSTTLDGELEFSMEETIQELAQMHESITYETLTVSGSPEVVEVLKSNSKVNLFVVGRSLPIAFHLHPTDCPELGPVGSFLARSDFSSTASVLVVQQYNPKSAPQSLVIEQDSGDVFDVPDTPQATNLDYRPATLV